jgi:hypothetical protein
MLPAGWVGRPVLYLAQSDSIHEGENSLRALERGALLDASLAAVNPDPLVRLRGVAQLQADYSRRDQLEQHLERSRRSQAARVESLNWLFRRQLLQMDKESKDQADRLEKEGSGAYPQDFRSEADMTIWWLLFVEIAWVNIPFSFWLWGLLGWPGCWVVWAFLFRGGLSYRLTGIRLVRADGRPASRLQCAWRALLVWAPVTAPLVLSCWLDARYWSAGGPDTPSDWPLAAFSRAEAVMAGDPWEPGAPSKWPLAAASASWYAAVGLLLAYVGLALWRPTRAPHDRLAGTYLVPR